ncbi:MAG: GHKL domain-containing protein [Bdellovibrionales bacterium]|nr:GHKL domain-containing protein [Bdellovibrionales bacterium]
MQQNDEWTEGRFRRSMTGKVSLWLGLLAVGAMVPRALISPMTPAMYIPNLISAFLLIFNFFLIRKSASTRACGLLLLAAIFALAVNSGINNGGLRAPVSAAFVLLPLVGYLSLGRFGGRTGVILTVFGMVMLLVAEEYDAIVPLVDSSKYTFYKTLVYSVGACFAYGIGISFDRARIETEKILVAQRQSASAAAKMAALGEMASGVAHEINNPLAIIRGRADHLLTLLEAGPVETERLKSDLYRMQVTTDRIARIIKGLKAFSRDSSRDPMEIVSIRSIVEDVVELSRERFFQRSIDLRVSIIDDLLLECRSAEVEQVLVNLINNNYDAIENRNEKWIEVSVYRQSANAVISVVDSGSGIEPTIVDKMMQPFYTTKEVGRGTGLGLSISKGIAEAHHGTLAYQIKAAHTQFLLSLPLRQPPA